VRRQIKCIRYIIVLQVQMREYEDSLTKCRLCLCTSIDVMVGVKLDVSPVVLAG
jgi:hypothetical protein